MEMEIHELEAKINAHRELLIAVLAILLSQKEDASSKGDLSIFYNDLLGESSVVNGQEDPGVIPTEAFAIAGLTAQETLSILEAARLRANAGQDKDKGS